MKIAGRKVPGVIVALGVLVGLVVLLQVAAWTVLPPLAGNVIRSQVGQASDGLYQLNFDRVHLRLFAQSLSLHDVALTYDTARVRQSVPLRQGKVYSGTVDRVTVNLASVWPLLFGSYLTLDAIEVDQPALYIHQFPEVPPPDSTQEDSPAPLFDAYRLIRPRLDSLRLSAFTIDSASVGMVRHRSAGSDTVSARGWRVRIREAFVDSVVARRRHGWPRMEEFDITWRSPSLTSVDSLYDYHADSISVDALAGSLQVAQFAIRPRGGKYEMGQQLNQQLNWVQLEVARLSASRINFPLLTDSLVLRVEKLAIEGADFTLFRDVRLPSREPSPRPLLQERLRSLPLPLRIDTLTVADGAVRYEERREGAERAGHVTFDSLYASFYGLANRPSDSTAVLVGQVRAYFMGKGPSSLHLEVPLASTDGTHRVSGKIDRINLTELNAATVPLAFTQIESGTAQQMKFDVEANEQRATGNVQLRYENLEISLLKKNASNQSGEELKSWLANTLVLKQSNPTGDKELRPGPIEVQRDDTQSLFSYWWSALRSGLMVSLGVKNSSKSGGSSQSGS